METFHRQKRHGVVGIIVCSFPYPEWIWDFPEAVIDFLTQILQHAGLANVNMDRAFMVLKANGTGPSESGGPQDPP
jgi:hypothetical protein